LKPLRRGLFRIAAMELATSAPIGLFVLSCVRRSPFEMTVLPAPAPWTKTVPGLSCSGDIALLEGDQWHDLRAYVPGDALARVHWRKADGDISNWVVKRFGSHAHSENDTLLRVDLRQPQDADEAAFEQLLGRVYSWVQQQKHHAPALILGQSKFDLGQKAHFQRALKALAAAEPESVPPAGQGGLLFSLMDGRH